MADFTVERLVDHPAFEEILTVAVALATAQVPVLGAMTREQRRRYADRANALSAQVKSGAGAKEDGVAREAAELFGLPEGDLDALMERARVSARGFVAAFPEFPALDGARKVDLLVEAIKRDPRVRRAAQRLASETRRSAAAAGESEQTCLAICLSLLVLFTAAAITMMVVGLVGCVGLGWIPPLMILCMIGVVAAFAAFMAITMDIYLNCVANCQEGGGGGD